MEIELAVDESRPDVIILQPGVGGGYGAHGHGRGRAEALQ